MSDVKKCFTDHGSPITDYGFAGVLCSSAVNKYLVALDLGCVFLVSVVANRWTVPRSKIAPRRPDPRILCRTPQRWKRVGRRHFASAPGWDRRGCVHGGGGSAASLSGGSLWALAELRVILYPGLGRPVKGTWISYGGETSYQICVSGPRHRGPAPAGQSPGRPYDPLPGTKRELCLACW